MARPASMVSSVERLLFSSGPGEFPFPKEQTHMSFTKRMVCRPELDYPTPNVNWDQSSQSLLVFLASISPGNRGLILNAELIQRAETMHERASRGLWAG